MAEKEERIRVLIAKNPCNECSVKKCTRKCTFGLLFEKAPGITRQEAIEKMAKAFFPWDFFPHEIEEGKGWNDLNEWQKGKYLAQARDALNALLEGK